MGSNRIHLLNAINDIVNYLSKTEIINELLNPFNDKEIDLFFIRNRIHDYEKNIKESYLKLIAQLQIYVLLLKEENVTGLDELLAYIRNVQDNLADLENIKNEELITIGKFNCVTSLYLCSVTFDYKLNDYNSLKSFLSKSKSKYFFRGQTKSKYGLLPSFYRSLKINDDVITYATVESKYKEHGFYQRYQTVFPTNDNRYQMMSYVQHSVSYSPLLDVSRSVDIATIFACSGKDINPNDYSSDDAALFMFQINEGSHKKKAKLNIKWFETKLDFTSIIKTGHKIDKFLFECSHEDFTISFSLISDMTNDRMKYQQGAFLFVEECVIVNGHLLIPNTQIDIFKIIIPSNMKKELYTELTNKLNFYETDKLYNPYQYVAEYCKKI